MASEDLHKVLDVFMTSEGQRQHHIEMRFYNDYDGDTEWHSMDAHKGKLGLGLFPWQAEYRLSPKGKRNG